VHLNPTSQEAISFSGIHNFNIHHNTLSNYGREGIDVKGSSQGGAIHHNSVYSSVTYTNNICIYIDPYSGTEFNVDIYNNYCTGNKGVGIAIGPEAGGTLHDVNIFNNIVDMTGIQGICIVNYGSSSGGTIYNIHIFNNIVRVKNSYAMYIEANSGEITGGIVIENNIFTTEGGDVIHSNNYALSSIFTLRNNICYDFSGTTNVWGNGYTIVDPKFVNRANSDFHLTSASTAAIDKLPSIQYITYVGNIVSLMFDYDNNSRPYNTLYDIGAYEYHETTTDTTPPLLSNIQLHTSTILDVEIGWENITCTATDDIAIQDVNLILTNSNKVTTTLPMLHEPGTSIYYYNTSLKQSGNYTYHIWADDTGNNKVNSIDTKFSLPPNWDINNDGRCTILDKVCISLHYGQTGTPGWIREDVDNSGEINILDLTSDSNQYNNYWWK
jgi:hypothetical protein